MNLDHLLSGYSDSTPEEFVVVKAATVSAPLDPGACFRPLPNTPGAKALPDPLFKLPDSTSGQQNILDGKYALNIALMLGNGSTRSGGTLPTKAGGQGAAAPNQYTEGAEQQKTAQEKAA